VAPFDSGVLLGAVDGLGHGAEAAAAACAAVTLLEAHRSEPVVDLVLRCHAGLVRPEVSRAWLSSRAEPASR
jgi:hypothetical protein